MGKTTCFVDKAKSSWVTPDGQVWQVLEPENHDRELPIGFSTVRKTEAVCIRITCGGGWHSGSSQIQLPNRITIPQKMVLQRLDDEVGWFKKLNFFFFINYTSHRIEYEDLMRLL